MSRFFNDGTKAPPRLAVYINLDNLADLRGDSIWPGLEGLPRYLHLAADGFEGIQLTTDDPPITDAPLPHCGLDRINTPGEADAIAAKHRARGDTCLTVHVGWGLEPDEEVFRLIDAVLEASDRHRLPIFIETHRATVTQDLWRTVQIVKKFPEIRFNGDFSHYYCGQELVYGDWLNKLAFMSPIFERIGFLHGRVASPGSMQVPIGVDLSSRPAYAHGRANYLEHFKQLWLSAMVGFLRAAGPGDVLIFAPELLSGTNYYARHFTSPTGVLIEESDRYAEALVYKDLARVCFAEAQRCIRS